MRITAGRFLGAAFVAVVLGVSGCAGGESGEAAGDAGDNKAVANSAAPAAKAMEGTIQELPDMGQEARGVVKDLKIKECPLEPGKHHVTGTIKNSGAEAQDVLAAYTWLANDSTDALARGVATAKDMKPGEEREWAMDIELKTKAARCIPFAKAAKTGTLK